MHEINRFCFLTVNTNDSVISFPTDVEQRTIAKLLPLVANGGGVIPVNPAYKVRITLGEGAAVFSVEHKSKPLILCTLVWNETQTDEMWNLLASSYPMVYGSPTPAMKPLKDAWLGVVLLPDLMQPKHFNTLMWMADFERSLAWTIVEFSRANMVFAQ